MRVDCTVVASDIHQPADSELLWDCVRVLTRLLRRARARLGSDEVVFANRTRRAKRRRREIFHAKGPEPRQAAYRDLLKVFPQLEGVGIDYAWSGLMSYARHQMPQIGRVEDGLWVGQAFGGHGVAPTTFAGEVLASAIVEGDTRWRDFSGYGLVSALKPTSFVAAQLTYWWAEFKDLWKDWNERRNAA